MQDLKKFCDVMYASPVSRIVLANLAHDLLEHDRVEPAAAARLIDVVAEAVETAQPGTVAPSPALARAAAHLLDDQLDSGTHLTFCNGRPIDGEQVSRIYEENILFTYLLHNATFGRPSRRRGSGMIERDFVEVLPDDVRDGAMITGRRPVAWVTTSETIETLVSTVDETDLATRVRDFLGLDTFVHPEQELVEVYYPEDDPPELHAPTFIEGSCRAVYRSAVADKGWGQAVDLAHPDLASGGPEAVHEPIPFRAGFKVRFLGPVKDGMLMHTDDALYNACPRKWDPDTDTELLRRRCASAAE